MISSTRRLRRLGASLVLLAIPAVVAILCAAPTAVEYRH
jgi:hypothetical protein